MVEPMPMNVTWEILFDKLRTASICNVRNAFEEVTTSALLTMKTPAVSYKAAHVNGFKIFYREAGDAKAPTVLLLHGFPTSSHMFRNLIPELAGDYHIVAPDLPGFGFSDLPDHKSFAYTFDHLAEIIGEFTQGLGLGEFAIYVFDYGAPVGFRLMLKYPEKIRAIISQNGNAYEEGLSDGWAPIRTYW